MGWVRGLCVLLTISVNVGVRMAVETTASSMSMVSTVPFDTNIKYHSTKTTTPTTLRTHKTTKIKHSISESIVILTPDSERQAKDAYDKALQQFDSYGISTRQTCTVWEKRGCQCSGTIEELILSCRNIGLNETPTILPKNLIKLYVE